LVKQMKQKIYIETSVISYLVARPSKNIVIAAHQTSTSDFWDCLHEYEVFISEIVIQEASKGDKVQAGGWACPEICSPEAFLGDEI